MNWKDIKTRRQLTQYLYGNLSAGTWGSCVLSNFDSPVNWTDEPVSQSEVATAIRDARRTAGGDAPAETRERRNPKQSSGASKSNRGGMQQQLVPKGIDEEAGRQLDGPESAGDTFVRLIAEYVDSQPAYRYPPGGCRHPAILAQGAAIKDWLIERMGPANYLSKLLDSARSWFPPGCDPDDFRTFCAMFECSGNVSWGNSPDYQYITDRYVPWMRSVRQAQKRRRFLLDDLRDTQRENFAQDFAHLAIMCCRRFASNARLHEVDESVIKKVTEIGINERVDVSGLRLAASEIWERCETLLDRPQQGDFFRGWPDSPEVRWNRYFYRVLAPHLVLDDDIVRHVLHALEVLTIKATQGRSEALYYKVGEIALPAPWN